MKKFIPFLILLVFPLMFAGCKKPQNLGVGDCNYVVQISLRDSEMEYLGSSAYNDIITLDINKEYYLALHISNKGSSIQVAWGSDVTEYKFLFYNESAFELTPFSVPGDTFRSEIYYKMRCLKTGYSVINVFEPETYTDKNGTERLITRFKDSLYINVVDGQ